MVRHSRLRKGDGNVSPKIVDGCLIGRLLRLCAANELGELGYTEDELIEECYVDRLEKGGVDLGQKALQVLASTVKVYVIETMEGGTSFWGLD